MEINRLNSIKAFSFVLKNENNIRILEKYIFDKAKDNQDKYCWFIYQTIGLLMKDKGKLKEISKNLKEGNIGWHSPIYDRVSKRIEEFDQYLVCPVEVVEGVIECPKCKGTKTWSVQKQTRGSDEPMTTFSKCVNCEYQWAYSG